MTFNLWFSPDYAKERIASVLSIVEETSPDFVAFQEVLIPILEIIKSHPFIRSTYSISDIDGTHIHQYGVVLLSKHPADPGSSRVTLLATRMGRSLVSASYFCGEVVVGTVHLESLNSPFYRRSQMETFHELYGQTTRASGKRSVVVVGDFNFDDVEAFGGGEPEENNALDQVLPGWTDVWSDLHPDARGATFDPDVNKMLHPGKETARYDRVMLGPSPLHHPSDISLLGCDPLPPPLAGVWPSDHFGLLSVFSQP